MRFFPFIATLLLVAGCAGSGPPAAQQANSASCDEFARSGGYPILQGGPVYGGNPEIEQLPGQPPLQLSGHGNSVENHLDEEDYLRRYCANHQ
jgi:hypothetical protein